MRRHGLKALRRRALVASVLSRARSAQIAKTAAQFEYEDRRNISNDPRLIFEIKPEQSPLDAFLRKGVIDNGDFDWINDPLTPL